MKKTKKIISMHCDNNKKMCENCEYRYKRDDDISKPKNKMPI